MKKYFYKTTGVLLWALLLISSTLCFTGCNEKSTSKKTGKTLTVCSIFPFYDWARNITAGTDQEIILLLKNGVDSHSYSPTARDIIQIQEGDLLFYAGGETDEWIEKSLENSSKKSPKGIALLETVMAQGRTLVEEDDECGEEHLEEEYDEHVWLSLTNAKIICSLMAEEFSSLDPENASVYKANLNSYLTQLDELDSQYREAISKAENKMLIFCDRYPFAYLVNDYSLEADAAFPGCSAESEASFETVIRLSNTAKEHDVKHLVILESGNSKIAKTVMENSGAVDVVVLDSMQSTTQKQVDDGKTFISTMKENLKSLELVLENK